MGVSGEVVIADNGSTDGSPAIARRHGARVVSVPEKGYGNALRAGIAAARGRFIVMGDSDDSYDFSRIEPFVAELSRGAGLVMGNRLAGRILPGAMPWKHRWIGNPALSGLGRLFFRSPVGDFHCGLRAFTREAYERMNLQTTGMEFASEMVIRATLLGLPIVETPIVLHKDGRSRPPHLRSWRDGWRHLRFMLLLSPLWLFFIPGLTLFLLGLAGCLWLPPATARSGGVELDIHSLLVMSAMCLIGYQILSFSAFTKRYAIAEGLHPPSRRLAGLCGPLSVELGVAVGLVLILVGGLLLADLTLHWRLLSFGHLLPRETMRRAIPAVLALGLGVQTLFASFFLGILSLKPSPPAARPAESAP